MRRRLALLFALALSALLTLALAIPAAAHHRFPERIDLPNQWQPEGITSGRGTTFYVGSLRNGAIWEGDFRTGEGEVLVESAEGPAVGIDYERRGGCDDDHHGDRPRHDDCDDHDRDSGPSRGRGDRLWVAGGNSHLVRVYDVKHGDLLATYTFASGFLNDVVVTEHAAYVTDSNIQQLIVIPLGRHGRLPDQAHTRLLPLSGDIAYTTGFNVNGITESRGRLIIVQSNKGLLFSVDPRTGNAKTIDIGTESVTAGDGVEVHGSTLYVVRNQLNLVAVFRLSDRLRSARKLGEITSPGLAVPTTATLNSGFLWAVNARFGTMPTPDTEYWVTRLPARP